MDDCTVREPNLASLSDEAAGDVFRGTEANKKEPEMAWLRRRRRGSGGWHAWREASGTWETHSAPCENGVGIADEPEASRWRSGSQITS
jgi:hypothetical protein